MRPELSPATTEGPSVTFLDEATGPAINPVALHVTAAPKRLDRKRGQGAGGYNAAEAQNRATSSRNNGRDQIGTVGDTGPE
jgi:hypothetical protein